MVQLKMCSANQELDVTENSFTGRLSAQEDCTLFLLPAIYYYLPALKLHNQVVECFVVFFLTQDIADSKILSLALVTLPTEKENWIVAGTHSGSLWAVNTEDETRRHRLQKMSDSVTCLYCNSLSKQRYTWLLNLLCYVSKMPLNRDVREVTAVHS